MSFVLAVMLLLAGLPHIKELSELPAMIISLTTSTTNERVTQTVQIDHTFLGDDQNTQIALKYGPSSTNPSDPKDPHDPNKHGCIWSIIITIVPTVGDAPEPIRANGVAETCKPQAIKDALKTALKNKGVDDFLQNLIEFYLPGL